MAAGSAEERSRGCCVCSSTTAPYTCPRCRVRYCSVPCYREHGQCAGAFYAESAEAAMKGEKVDDETKRRTAELLLRSYQAAADDGGWKGQCGEEEEEEEEEEDEEATRQAVQDAADRLSELEAAGELDAAAAEAVLARLPRSSRSAFQAILQSGGQDLDRLVQQATPGKMWWEDEHGLRLEGGGEAEVFSSVEAPQLPPPLPPLSTLLAPGAPLPPPVFTWGVVDVLCSYAAVRRVYAGGWEGDEGGARDSLLDVSPLLAADAAYAARRRSSSAPPRPPHDSPTAAVDAVSARCVRLPAFRGGGSALVALLARDSARLFESGTRGVRALHESERLFRAAGQGKESGMTRKLFFMQSWLRGQD
eukprot:Hpha_TRINITY_DN16341_c0_g1::TRINITY_DN16341_c0_g1_i2::g.59727::m.59727